ncbi:hypothetical protein ABIA30_005088 [Mycobacterium sp. MAA66]
MAKPAERRWFERQEPRPTRDEVDAAGTAFRLANGLDDEDDDWSFDDEPAQPDPIVADVFGGISRRALAEARDNLASATTQYEHGYWAYQDRCCTDDSVITRPIDQAGVARFPSSVAVTTIRAPSGSPSRSTAINASSVVVARNLLPSASRRPMMMPVYGVQS